MVHASCASSLIFSFLKKKIFPYEMVQECFMRMGGLRGTKCIKLSPLTFTYFTFLHYTWIPSHLFLYFSTPPWTRNLSDWVKPKVIKVRWDEKGKLYPAWLHSPSLVIIMTPLITFSIRIAPQTCHHAIVKRRRKKTVSFYSSSQMCFPKALLNACTFFPSSPSTHSFPKEKIEAVLVRQGI